VSHLPQSFWVQSVDHIPRAGVRETAWRYDHTGQLESIDVTSVDGETATVTDPAAIAALNLAHVAAEVWSYDDTGAPEAVSITSVDGETVTITDPAAIAALITV
jgi:hypothetical protein